MKTIKILHIGEDPELTDTLNSFLCDKKFSLTVANSLQEGMNKLFNEKFEVLILSLIDKHLIKEAVPEIIINSDTDLPLIVISDLKDESDKLSLIEIGVQDVLQKDELSEKAINRAVNYSISRSRFLKNNCKQQPTILKIKEEYRKINRSLYQSQDNFFRFISGAPIGIRIVTPKGETIFVNKALLDIYEYNNLAEFNDTPVENRYTAESLIDFKIRRANRKSGKETGATEYRISIIRKSGEVRHLQVHRKKTLWDNKIQFQVVYEDITERIKAEQESTLKTKQLHESIAEKDKFLSIIAHDLRGPIGTFVTATQMISEEMNDMDKEEIKDMITNIHISAVNVYNLLENLLQWHKFKKDGIEFLPRNLSLKNYLNTSIETCIKQAEDKEISIKKKIPEALEVYADIYMFDTIIRNILTNAIKFTPKGGIVVISAKETNDHSVEIEIKDSGIGIPAGLISGLFKLDKRIHRKGTEGEPGTGLGLLLCHELTERHGGEIRVKSDIEEGTTFGLIFPKQAIKK